MSLLRYLNPMGLLLRYEGYPPAVVASVALHVVLLYFLLGSNFMASEFVDLEDPVYINATTVQQNPQRLRRLEQLEQQRIAQQREDEARRRDQQLAQQRREQEEQAAREQAAREQAAREAAERQEQERQQSIRQEQERQRLADEAQQRSQEQERLAQQRAEQQRQEELRQQQLQQQAAERQAAEDENNIQSYTQVIRDAVAINWSVPPSARNGMMVIIRLQMVPTGEVVSVNLVQSSGDAAFDRSAIQAVYKAERFPELQEMSTRLFNQYFRTINLQFRPEDLLR